MPTAVPAPFVPVTLAERAWAYVCAFLEELHAANERTQREAPFGL